MEKICENIRRARLKISCKFAWYDLWIGAFVDVRKKIIYVCLIPTFPIVIDMEKRTNNMTTKRFTRIVHAVMSQGNFFTGVGDWSSDPLEAHRFQSIQSAESFLHSDYLKGMT